jgi:hypothetical protein
VRKEVLQHRLGGDSGGKAVPSTHHPEPLPLSELGGQVMEAGGPLGSGLDGCRVRREVEATVQVAAEAGESVPLLCDALLNKVAGALAELQVLAP